jgi:pyocin large subunit-like protein
VPNPVNPQSLNRYSYVNNNPLRYTDPTGHYCVEEDADGNIIHMNCGSWEPIGGGGNGGGGLDEDEDNEPDLHIELGNPSCDSACEQMLEGLFVAATM